MVVIDGIADLVRCANDEAESVSVIDELYRLAGIYKTCIFRVPRMTTRLDGVSPLRGNVATNR
jgi:hypothetical protein